MLHHPQLTRHGLTGAWRVCRTSPLPAEAVAPASHQLRVSITDLTRWTFTQAPGTLSPAAARAAFTTRLLSLSGVYSLKDSCTRGGTGRAVQGLGNGSCGLKEMRAWEMRSSVTCSRVFHKHMCKIKKFKATSATREQQKSKQLPRSQHLGLLCTRPQSPCA